MARELHSYDELDKRDAHGRTLLMCMCEHGSDSMVKGLLHHKADATSRDYSGVDALSRAAKRPEATDIVGALLQCHAQPDAADGAGQTPLMLACEAGAVRTAELLLRARACPTRCNSAGKNALALSAQHSKVHELVCKWATGESITPPPPPPPAAPPPPPPATPPPTAPPAAAGASTSPTSSPASLAQTFASPSASAPALLQRRVELRGLSGRPELNGCRGVAVSFDPKTGRYGVQLDGKGREKVALRPATLRALGEEEEEEDLAAATMALPVSSLGVSVGEGEPLAAFGDDSGRELDDGVNDEIVIRAGRDALQRLMRGDDDDDGSGGGGGGAGGGAGGGSGGGGGGDGVGDGSDSNPAKDVNTAAGAATAAAVASAAEPMALTSAGGKPIAEAVVRFQAEVDALETAWKAAASSVDAACADAPGGMERSPAPA